MKTPNIKVIYALLLVGTIGLSCYSIFQWQKYWQRNVDLVDSIQQVNKGKDVLNEMDVMVLSGSDSAYMNCNQNLKWLSSRDYILYCYIVAIRDNNAMAGLNCSTFILQEMREGKIPADKSLLHFVEHFSKIIESDPSIDSSHMGKFTAAYTLEEIYSGELSESMKDTLQYQRYHDAMTKYAKYIQ